MRGRFRGGSGSEEMHPGPSTVLYKVPALIYARSMSERYATPVSGPRLYQWNA